MSLLPTLTKVMAAIRTELNLGNNPEQAQRQMETQLAQMTAQMDALLAHLTAE